MLIPHAGSKQEDKEAAAQTVWIVGGITFCLDYGFWSISQNLQVRCLLPMLGFRSKTVKSSSQLHVAGARNMTACAYMDVSPSNCHHKWLSTFSTSSCCYYYHFKWIPQIRVLWMNSRNFSSHHPCSKQMTDKMNTSSPESVTCGLGCSLMRLAVTHMTTGNPLCQCTKSLSLCVCPTPNLCVFINCWFVIRCRSLDSILLST